MTLCGESAVDIRSFEHGTYQASESHRSLIEPKKLPNPVRESKHHRELHRELIFTQRRGILPEHKPELQRVLEARRIKQLKQQEETQKPLTDLEEELRKRQQKLDQEPGKGWKGSHMIDFMCVCVCVCVCVL
uniref:Family with sequence similarity 107 member A n=1 Tax=Podarcis muralis TaxID=64176 RepID=A0A670J882_PODMU